MIQQSVIDEYNRKKLINLIREVSDLWGGDEEKFLDEYIAETVKQWSNNLQAAIDCFTELKAQAVMLTPIDVRSKLTSKEVRTQGHKAFRDHYDRMETTKRR